MDSVNGRPAALVTGGSEGIGFACALRLGRMGYRVCLAARSREKLEAAQSRLSQEGVEADIFPLDVSDLAQVRGCAAHLEQQFGRVDVLINAAGCSMPGRYAFEDIRDADYLRILRTNTDGMFFVSREILRIMRRQDSGCIVNILSTAAHGVCTGNAPYSASKSAAMALSETMVEECRGTGVRICSISPGPVATTIWTHKETPPPASELDKMLRPEDIADIAAFLIERPANVHIGDIVVTPWYF